LDVSGEIPTRKIVGQMSGRAGGKPNVVSNGVLMEALPPLNLGIHLAVAAGLLIASFVGGWVLARWAQGASASAAVPWALPANRPGLFPWLMLVPDGAPPGAVRPARMLARTRHLRAPPTFPRRQRLRGWGIRPPG